MKRVIGVAFLIALMGCSRTAVPSAVPDAMHPPADAAANPLVLGNHKITHIIVVVQENRTVDNLFNGYPGANTVRSAKNSYGQTIELHPVSLAAPYDIGHDHSDWLNEYNNGLMNGFNLENEKCYLKRAACPPHTIAAYAYVPKSEVRPYWILARRYVLANNMFETSQGPSFPAHQYLVSGTSSLRNGADPDLLADSNASYPGRLHEGGCDSTRGTKVQVITDAGTSAPPVYPCFERRSIMDRFNRDGVQWRYYQAKGGPGQWNALDAIKSIRYSQSYSNVIWPSKKFLKDIGKGELAQVTYITPNAAKSDHPGHTNGSGPAWVASVVNAVGESRFWDTTAIFIVWDDWGGWYDHVSPRIYSSYELGFRVPLLVVSPYAKSNYISSNAHEFGSILKFIEETLNVHSLGTTDVRSDDLSDCFDFTQSPRKFEAIPGALSPNDVDDATNDPGDDPD